MCNTLKNIRTQIVELVTPAGNTQQRIQFTDQPYLRGMSILGLETYSINDLALSPQGNKLPTATVLKNAYITFYTTDPTNANMQGQWIQDLPMWNLHNLQNTASDPFERWPFLLAGQTILWEKSYITLVAPPGNTDPLSFIINVSFEDKTIISV